MSGSQVGNMRRPTSSYAKEIPSGHAEHLAELKCRIFIYEAGEDGDFLEGIGLSLFNQEIPRIVFGWLSAPGELCGRKWRDGELSAIGGARGKIDLSHCSSNKGMHHV